ncbi:MAG: efflux RND transporter permease subunit [Magnetococcales bacterium]|nr:efflux RND transporter permease subunit [Magnetococcales bacterium]
MLRSFLGNHVLATLVFLLVLSLGGLSYGLLPRQQDPEMSFNWISITTPFPSASAEDVERLVTDPLEEAVEKIDDIRFAASNSRQGMSSILVRFEELASRDFDKRLADLRREIQNKERDLPEGAEDPLIIDITTANAFPTASVVVQGQADDENLRRQARQVKEDLERLKGVGSVLPVGLAEPELQVQFRPERLEGLGVAPTALADLLAIRFRDLSGGTVEVGEESWLLRTQGTTAEVGAVARWPLPGIGGEVTLGEVAEVVQGRKKPVDIARFEGRPAVFLAVTKQAMVNSLELTARVREYVEGRNRLESVTGVRVFLADDQTELVRSALTIMGDNAIAGLLLVFLVTWLFFGLTSSILISLGIPFALMGTFAILYAGGESLNVMVLLGLVIAMGMLVDDSIVVIEAIHLRLRQGMTGLTAAIEALREVAIPVTTAVLTTMAAFLPLMLLPGILGQFMKVIPLVVTLTLALSLVEAFWMLPAHVVAWRLALSTTSRLQLWRNRVQYRLRHAYGRALVGVLRRPRLSLGFCLLPFVLAAWLVAAGMVRVDFFAMDPLPLFYVNVTAPPGMSLQRSLGLVEEVEKRVRGALRPGEARAVVAYAGQMFTETEPLFGDRYGQVMVSLEKAHRPYRTPGEIIEAMRPEVTSVPGAASISFQRMSGGPPVSKPVNIKVRGDDFAEIRGAVEAIKGFLRTMPEVSDIVDTDTQGRWELALVPDGAAIQRSGVSPATVMRLLRLMGDGEVVASFQEGGEKREVRVLAEPRPKRQIEDLLHLPVALVPGESVPLGHLARAESRQGAGQIRHHDFRRTIGVEADLDLLRLDILQANTRVMTHWREIQGRFPGVSLDFSGVMDDITESLDDIFVLFLMGIGLIYTILGTQFRSYFQPLIILVTVPMAFTGVVFGLFINGHPLSLYTLYGVVALSGIAVNSAIVMVAAANDRREAGHSVVQSIFWAGRRRLVSILVTSFTTVASLLSLATGLAGQSLLWGPVATSIVWGLGFSTILTLFLIPLLYGLFMDRVARRRLARG